jgi:hypothetical protein
MITYEKVIGADECLGQPAGLSATSLQINGDVTTRVEATEDWFGGNIAEVYSEGGREEYSIGEPFAGEGEFEVRIINSRNSSYTYSNGGATEAFEAQVIVDTEEGGGAAQTEFEGVSQITYAFGWSQAPVTLATYYTEEITQTCTTTGSETFALSVTTTSEVSSAETTTRISTEATRMTTAQSQRSVTVWQTSNYETTYVTGETTAKAFLSDSYNVPVILSNQSSATTVSETIERLSFVSLTAANSSDEYENTYPAGTQSATLSSTVNDTRPIDLRNSRFPQVTNNTVIGQENTFASSPFGQFKIGFGTTQALTYSQTVTESFAAHVTQEGKRTESAMFGGLLGGGNVQVVWRKTTTSQAENVYTYKNEETVDGVSISRSGGHALVQTSNFATIQSASVLAATSVLVGVSAGGGVGARPDTIASGAPFYLSNQVIAIPGYGAVTHNDKTVTISANSYTQGANGTTESGVWNVEGEPETLWRLAQWEEFIITGGPAPNNEFVAPETSVPTIVGGIAEGAAIIYQGVYKTYAGNSSGYVTKSEPQAVSWGQGAETTGYSAALSIETVVDQFTPNVIASARHPVSWVIDD